MARKALSLVVVGKLVKDYRSQMYSVLILSNPVANFIKQVLQFVAKDVSQLNAFIKRLLMNTDNLTAS
jgi:hypothetical protein